MFNNLQSMAMLRRVFPRMGWGGAGDGHTRNSGRTDFPATPAPQVVANGYICGSGYGSGFLKRPFIQFYFNEWQCIGHVVLNFKQGARVCALPARGFAERS